MRTIEVKLKDEKTDNYVIASFTDVGFNEMMEAEKKHHDVHHLNEIYDELSKELDKKNNEENE